MLGCLATLIFLSAILLAPTNADAFAIKDKIGDDEIKLKIYGFSQLEARGGDGVTARVDESDDGLRFSAQRIRIGMNYYYGNMFGKLFLDFNQPDTRSAGMPRTIKDAFVGYKWCDSAFLRLGMIKTPLGMDFTIPGWNLDIVQRGGLEKQLVLERDMGLLLSGRFIGFGQKEGSAPGTAMGHEKSGKGIGYDIGVFNPADRSGSVVNGSDVTGDALAYVGRLHFDWGEPLHCEVAYGVSEQAGGEDTEDYKVFDAGVNSYLGALNLKLEYIMGQNMRGVKDTDQSTLVGTVGYMLNSEWELVCKHYQSNSETAAGADTDLGNTYLGVAYFITNMKLSSDEITRKVRRKLQNHRVMFNYVFASGDDDTWSGRGGFTDDAYLLQWQYKF
jgi:hypothetical protein